MGKDACIPSLGSFLYLGLGSKEQSTGGQDGVQSFLGVSGDMFDLQKMACARN